MRLNPNPRLERKIEHTMVRPVGRPQKNPQIFYHDFPNMAVSRERPRRVIAKVEWRLGELFARVGFIVTNLYRYMSEHSIGEGAFVYVADSAMVTPDNLASIGDNLFITRLSATYAETARVKKARRLTTFMMTTKFKWMLVARIDDQWFLTTPFNEGQRQFVCALGLSEEIILRRGVLPHPAGRKITRKSARRVRK